MGTVLGTLIKISSSFYCEITMAHMFGVFSLILILCVELSFEYNNNFENEVLKEFYCEYLHQYYKPNQKIPNDDPCKICHCSAKHQKVVCQQRVCPTPTCVEYKETPKGQCCPICKYGTNCWVKKDLIWGYTHTMIPVNSGC